MSLWELIVLAVGVSMDAFAVSVCKGLATPKARLRHSFICGAWFGGFQALMPLIGFFLGSLFAEAIEMFDHWVAFGLLAIIGFNTLKEALKSDCECCENHSADFAFKTMFVMAIATSIDALAVGVGLAMEITQSQIFLAVLLIGITTFLFCAVGVKLGNIFGSKFEKPAQIAGGTILILLGLKILLEGLNVIKF